MSTNPVPKRRGRPPKVNPELQEEVSQNVGHAGPSQSKKKSGKSVKKVKEDPTPREHITLQEPRTHSGELEGINKKKWVKFMKDVKV